METRLSEILLKACLAILIESQISMPELEKIDFHLALQTTNSQILPAMGKSESTMFWFTCSWQVTCLGPLPIELAWKSTKSRWLNGTFFEPSMADKFHFHYTVILGSQIFSLVRIYLVLGWYKNWNVLVRVTCYWALLPAYTTVTNWFVNYYSTLYQMYF